VAKSVESVRNAKDAKVSRRGSRDACKRCPELMSRGGKKVNPMEGTVGVVPAEAEAERSRRRSEASRRMVSFTAR